MIRALTLALNPATIWDHIARDRKNLSYVFMAYFLPVMLLAALGEGYILLRWGTWTAQGHDLMHFDLGQILIFETMRSAVTFMIVLACSYLVWLLKDPFYARYNFPQTLMLLMYSLSPLLMFQVLNGVPRINLWLPWIAGICFSLRIYYYGVRALAKTDPRSATGLFMISSAVIIILTGTQRFMLIQCLTDHGSSLNSLIYDLAAKF